MTSFLICLFLGALLIVLGAINTTGNISSLHSYHRRRVSEEDRKPFGRLVGIGTILCGAGVLLMGTATFLAEKTQISAFSIVGAVLLIVCFVVGLGLNFYAMIKYNGGIF